MKLSREGAARLGCHEARGFPVNDFEFKPEDFNGSVTLTVEEAKLVLALYDQINLNLSVYSKGFRDELRKRIEQVEMSKQSTCVS